MARGVKLSEELRAAIQADLLAGESVTKVAEKYSVHEATVRGWKKALPKEELTEVHAKKESEIAERVHRYLCANLDALIVQSEVAGEKTYLQRYPPNQLAILHGVMADKAARVLEVAYGVAGREDTSGEGQTVPEPQEGTQSQTFGIEEFADNTSTNSALGAD